MVGWVLVRRGAADEDVTKSGSVSLIFNNVCSKGNCLYRWVADEIARVILTNLLVMQMRDITLLMDWFML